jgi:hypothetical protein
MDEVKAKLIKARPTLKESSIKSYLDKLRKLNKMIGDKTNLYSFDVLHDIDAVIECLKDKSDNTRKTHYSTICVLLMLEEEPDLALIDKYRVEGDELSKKIKSYNESQQKNEKQQESWTSMEQLRSVIKDIEKTIKFKRLFSANALTKNEFHLIQDFVIGHLYVMHDEHPPVRCDYAGMRVVRQAEYNRMNEEELKKNYLVVRSISKKFFHIADFKTNHSMNTQIIPVCPELNKVLNKWLKINKSRDLLLDTSGNPLSHNQLSKAVKRIFTPLNKPRLGLSLIRHIYISEKFPSQKTEQTEVANKMLHSHFVQQNIYVKE